MSNGINMATESLVSAIPLVFGAGLLTYTIKHFEDENQQNKVSYNGTILYRQSANLGEVI